MILMKYFFFYTLGLISILYSSIFRWIFKNFGYQFSLIQRFLLLNEKTDIYRLRLNQFSIKDFLFYVIILNKTSFSEKKNPHLYKTTIIVWRLLKKWNMLYIFSINVFKLSFFKNNFINFYFFNYWGNTSDYFNNLYLNYRNGVCWKNQRVIFSNKLMFLKTNKYRLYKNIFNFTKRIFLKNLNKTELWKWYLIGHTHQKLIILNKKYLQIIGYLTPIRYIPTDLTKLVNTNINKTYKIFYLRKKKIFNKSRYSRNRQLYRTGVYWCLWVSVFLGWGLYFIFYRYSINFGYLWWLVYLILSIFIFVKSLKNNFFNLSSIYKEVISINKWLLLIKKNFENNLFEVFFFFKKTNILVISYLSKLFKQNLNNLDIKDRLFIYMYI